MPAFLPHLFHNVSVLLIQSLRHRQLAASRDAHDVQTGLFVVLDRSKRKFAD